MPLQGRHLFDTVRDKGTIIMAANTRMSLVTEGIFEAAKEARSLVMIELAKSESDLAGGYTGLTPSELSKRTAAAAESARFDGWLLHADHLTIKKGDENELVSIKALVKFISTPLLYSILRHSRHYKLVGRLISAVTIM